MPHGSTRTPLILGFAERNLIDRSGKEAILSGFCICKLQLHGMIVVAISVHEHDGPATIRSFYRVGSDKHVPGFVRDVTRRLEQLVHCIHWLRPLLGYHLRGEILRWISDNAIIPVHGEKWAGMAGRGYVVKIERAAGSRGHHRTHIVGKPECLLDIRGFLVALHVALGHEERDVGRQTIVFPDLNDVTYESGLAIEVIPCIVPWIVLERKEREVVQSAVAFQVVQETTKKRSVAICVRPYLDISKCSLEGWPSQLRVRDKPMNRSRKLYIERSVIFRKHALSIRLFAHFDSRYRIVPLVEIGDLICGILGSSIQHCNRHDDWEAAGNSTVKEEIESDLISHGYVEIRVGVPGVDRRNPGDCLFAAGYMIDQVGKLPVS